MNWGNVLDIFLDSLFDSLKVFGITLLLYFVLSFLEGKIAALLERNKKAGPIFGSLSGAIPQCGLSVVASDLYTHDHITLGALIAIFISCSDEALPIIWSDFTGKWYMGFILLTIKIAAGIFFGYLIEFLDHKGKHNVHHHLEECEGEFEIHKGCCGHNVESNDEETFIHEHILHPLIHSLKIFLYVLVVSFLFGLFFEWLGSIMDLEAFLSSSYWFTPLVTTLIGLVPNCASSVLVSELYLGGVLPFGALVSGLTVNAGLGPLLLLKDKKNIKKALLIEAMLIAISLFLGYLILLISL